ncbi:hypothetical protein [Methylovirgula sp. 4M-Z18]|uniref:hypothetical protein n=1 Tax=Methylovirgula sp. 4M-Z18 TaxID=2293567 RepID=UPI000E2F128E|nr:hypothetical protein [Methylovirgula sp. 4M-Z18]RFB80020.1 hypothetical protein DYH55_00255 [Methylovirgula sp. 4M-Z18]
MPGDILILGDIVFDNVTFPFATPSKISGGVEQQLGVSQLIGGARNVDAMGGAPLPIKWQGRWRGAEASANNDAMLALAQSGDEVACSWGEYFYNVVVKSYAFDYEAAFEIAYELDLTVLPGEAAPLASSLDDLVGGDMGAASAAAVFQ